MKSIPAVASSQQLLINQFKVIAHKFRSITQGFFVNNISGYAKFFPVFSFKYNPKNLPFQAKFLTFFSHLPQKQSLSLANFSNFYTDFIHS